MTQFTLMHLQIQIACSSRDEANLISRTLVEERLAACIQVSGPVTSTYRWQGNIESDEEWMCTAKTIDSLYTRFEERIKELHSYDNPEIIATPIERGSAEYLGWLENMVDENSSG